MVTLGSGERWLIALTRKAAELARLGFTKTCGNSNGGQITGVVQIAAIGEVRPK